MLVGKIPNPDIAFESDVHPLSPFAHILYPLNIQLALLLG